MQRLARTLLAIGLMSLPTLSSAQEAECKGEIKKFCKDATGKDVLTCMEQHKDEYAAPCKDKIAAIKDKWADFVKACQPELEKTCGDKKVSDGSLGKCVKEKEKSVGTGCKSAYAMMKAPLPKGVKMPAGLKLP